ncbi:MAG: hypothetical protein Q7U12_12180 [Undibacterium sp.]|nr:hypothetical protein [Undibacterium sp.]
MRVSSLPGLQAACSMRAGLACFYFYGATKASLLSIPGTPPANCS